LALLGEMDDFLTNLFLGTMLPHDPKIKAYIYVLVSKLNTSYFERKLPTFKEVEFIYEVLNSIEYTDSLCFVFMFILKNKFNITEYNLLAILKERMEANDFLDKYLVVNQYSTTKPLDYLDDYFTNYLNLEYLHLKGLYDSFNQFNNIQIVLSAANDFVFFERHMNLATRLNEIFNIDSNAKIMLYGTANSGKTTLAKLFTSDNIIFDIDETIEINVRLT
jgi:hypothetical protein